MKKLILCLSILAMAPMAMAKGGGFGLNAGVGLPFVSQFGLNYMASDTWSFHVNYGNLSVDAGEASVDLTMPDVMVNWHPFGGSFFFGLGVGSLSIEVSGTDTLTSLPISAEFTATAMIAKIGWMWGIGDGGFWFGIDASMISPTGADITIDADPSINQAAEDYVDVEDATEQFGEAAFPNVTFARIGYIF